MALRLSEIVLPSYLQTLGAVGAFMDRAKGHCEAEGLALSDIVETRLFPDMFPFAFQIASVAHHSLGALRGAQAGEFLPPRGAPPADWAALRALVSEAADGVKAFNAADVDALEGRDMVFRLGDNKLPFSVEGFLLSFSFPNFHFHATTAYDILRMKGVPLGKRDYMGQMRLKMG